jgi:hypothetical protein
MNKLVELGNAIAKVTRFANGSVSLQIVVPAYVDNEAGFVPAQSVDLTFNGESAQNLCNAIADATR